MEFNLTPNSNDFFVFSAFLTLGLKGEPSRASPHSFSTLSPSRPRCIPAPTPIQRCVNAAPTVL